jgi:hypothetical protein
MANVGCLHAAFPKARRVSLPGYVEARPSGRAGADAACRDQPEHGAEDYHLSFDPASKPAHCFVLDISIVGEYGSRLTGPPAREVFAPIPRSWLQEALEDSLEWHADHETLLHYSVLNACRSWCYAKEGIMSSKDDAAVWALSHAEDPSIIDSALAIRRGDRSRSLDPAEVRTFALGIKARIAQMPR